MAHDGFREGGVRAAWEGCVPLASKTQTHYRNQRTWRDDSYIGQQRNLGATTSTKGKQTGKVTTLQGRNRLPSRASTQGAILPRNRHIQQPPSIGTTRREGTTSKGNQRARTDDARRTARGNRRWAERPIRGTTGTTGRRRQHPTRMAPTTRVVGRSPGPR